MLPENPFRWSHTVRVGGKGASEKMVTVTDVEGPRYQIRAVEWRRMAKCLLYSNGWLISPPAKYLVSSRAVCQNVFSVICEPVGGTSEETLLGGPGGGGAAKGKVCAEGRPAGTGEAVGCPCAATGKVAALDGGGKGGGGGGI